MLVTTRKKCWRTRRPAATRREAPSTLKTPEMVWGIVHAAEELRSPVIIQTTSSSLKYLSPAYFAGIVRAAADATRSPWRCISTTEQATNWRRSASTAATPRS